jgi:hypothetical protein
MDDPVAAGDPDEFAVPTPLVPGGGGDAEIACAAWVVAGIVEAADIGRAGWHAAYATPGTIFPRRAF